MKVFIFTIFICVIFVQKSNAAGYYNYYPVAPTYTSLYNSLLSQLWSAIASYNNPNYYNNPSPINKGNLAQKTSFNNYGTGKQNFDGATINSEPFSGRNSKPDNVEYYDDINFGNGQGQGQGPVFNNYGTGKQKIHGKVNINSEPFSGTNTQSNENFSNQPNEVINDKVYIGDGHGSIHDDGTSGKGRVIRNTGTFYGNGNGMIHTGNFDATKN